MVLGEFITESTQYGKQEVTVKPKEGITLEEAFAARQLCIFEEESND